MGSNAHRGTGSRSTWKVDAQERRKDGDHCHYAGQHGMGPCSGRLTDHHPVELVDGGDRNWTVRACEGHHDAMTKTNAKKRTGRAPAAAKGAHPKTAAPPRWVLPMWVRVPVAVAVLAAGASALDRRYLWLGLAFAAGLGYVQYTAACRAIARRRVVHLAARELPADPSRVGKVRWEFHLAWPPVERQQPVTAWMWEGGVKARPLSGVVTYPDTVPDGPGAPGRGRVEDVFLHKLGVGVGMRVEWDSNRDLFRWAVATPDEVEDGGQVDDTQPLPVDASTPTPIAATLEEHLNKTFKVNPAKSDPIRVAVTQTDDVGPLTLVIHYPSGFADDEDAVRGRLLDQVTAKAGHRWKTEWDTTANRVTFTRRPELPTRVDNPGDAAEGQPWHVLEFATGEHGQTVALDVKKNPHTLVAGPTRQGKTVTVRTLILRAARNGFDVVAVDPKQVEFDGYEDVPGVTVAAEDEENIEAVEKVWSAMKRRYAQKRGSRIPLDSHRPLLLIVDEYQEFVETCAEMWAAEAKGNRGAHPVVSKVKSIARLGAAANVFLILLTQRPDSSWFDGILRSNLLNRMGVGTLDPECSRMLFGTGNVGRDVPEGMKGRINFRSGGGEILELQGFWTPNPGADDLTDEDRALLERVVHTEAERRQLGRPAAPVPAGGEPDVLDADDLAAAVQDGEAVRVILDGDVVTITSVEVGDDGDGVRLYYRAGDGPEQVAEFSDDPVFEVAPEPAAA